MIELSSPSPKVIEETIKSKESFLLIDISGYEELMKYCNLIENIIEGNSMTCRVITKGRTLAALPFILTPAGMAVIASQLVHKIATRNPDWKIVRNILNKKIEVRFCSTK